MAQSITLLQGPSPVETTILHFKLQCKVKIFDTKIKYASGNCSVVAASQHYGLIFVGTTTGFLIIKADSLNSSSSPDKYLCKSVHLNLRPAFLSIDHSQKILAVTCNSKAGAIMFLFSIAVLLSKKVAALKFHAVSHLTKNPTAEVVDVVWQPNADGGMAICMTDGSVLSFSQPTANEPPFTLPSTTQATCLCWSPKGKQIVIGSAEGTLSQYKPDLKLVKTLPKPPLYLDNIAVLNVLWISNYQFLAVYTSRDDPNFFPVFTIYNAAKNEPITVINFEDVTYTTNLFRIHQPYMIHQVFWNMIFVTSSNSVEVAVLFSKDGNTWEQWLMGDASRAELPLNSNKEETFPLGWAFDYTSAQSIPWGEGSLPPMPRLLILTDEGLLCVFNVINTTPNLPQLCAPPAEVVEELLFSKIQPESESVPFDTPKSGDTKPSFGSAATFEAFSAQPVIITASASQVPSVSPSAPVTENKDVQISPQQQHQQHQQQHHHQQQQQHHHQQQQQQQQQQHYHQQQQQQQQHQQQPLLPLQPSQFPMQQPPASVNFFGAAPAPALSNTSLLMSKPTPPSETPNLTKPETPKVGILGVKPTFPQSDSFSKSFLQLTPVKQPEPVPKETSKPEIPKKAEESHSEGESPSPGAPEIAAVDDSVYLKALQEEIDHFDSELRQLKAKVGSLDIHLGTEEDKLKMRKSIEGFTEFWKELKETTEGQSSEIHAVVLDLMEAFAWLENAKSRNLQRKNPSYIELKKSEELDPLSARYMSEISHLKYYIENQLKQLSNYLDKEWMDHQENYRNQIKKEMAVPPLEEVYKTMHLQLKILHKQRMLVEELKEKVSTRKRKNKSPMSITSDSLICTSTPNRYSELSKLAQNLLQLKIDKVEHPKQEASEILKGHLQSIAERTKKLSRDKQAALRDALSERDTVKIRPVKTTFETSSFLRSLSSQKTVQPKTEMKPLEPKPAFVPPVSLESFNTNSKPQPLPNLHSQPQPKAQAQPKPQPQSQPQTQPLFLAKSVSQSQPQFQSLPQTVPQVLPQTKSLFQPQPQPQSQTQSQLQSQSPSQPQSQSQFEKKSTPQPETPKGIFVFGSAKPVENPVIPLTVKALPKAEEKSPLASLSGIVSNIGKKTEPPAFVFGSQKQEPKAEQKPEEKAFTFGMAKPGDLTFGKKEPSVFGAKPSFSFGTPVTPSTKPEVTITPIPVTTYAVTTATPAFTFNFTSATTTTTTLPKMNLIFGKEPTTITTTAAIFGGTKTTNLFETPKTTEAPTQVAFSLTKSGDNKVAQEKEIVVASVVKQTEEVEAVNVEDVEEIKKPEAPKEVAAAPPSMVTTASESPKSTVVTTMAPNITPVTTTPATPVSVPETPTTNVKAAVPTTAVSNASSLSTTSSLIFGQAAATTSIFGQPTTTTASVFGQVSSTTPTTSIFGSVVTTTTSTFGSSAFSKSIFGQTPTFGVSTPITTTTALGATTPSTTTAFETTTSNIFGGSTTSPTFGQKPDPVAQTANIFNQLLSDNRSVFGANTTASTTTTNIFSTPKNIFGGGSTTTSSIFSTPTTSIFPQTTSVFGQQTTSTNVFGQPTTPTTGSFFNQNICSPFGGNRQQTTPTSNQAFESGNFNKPIFGATTFGQSPGNTSIFGGSPVSSIFGGGSSTTTSANIFQTPTTSSTFGSTSPGPFSSGGGSVAETGFGAATNTFQSPMGGFGSSPVFQSGPSAPAFGGSPTFGGSASFGSLPSFGSFSQGGFGQSSGSATFGNLANQNTVGFGNLAQQSQGGFGSPGFENKSTFGGNSFSSWRSK